MISRRPLAPALVAAALLLAASQGRGEDAAPAEPPLGPATRDYDQVQLDLDLHLDLEQGTLEGTAEHTLVALRDGFDRVRMHLADLEVRSAEVEGRPVPASRSGDTVSFALGRPRSAGERLTLTIRYGGRPTSGIWFFRPTEAHPEVPLQVWTQGQRDESRHWFPCYDAPDDRLATRLRVNLPEGLTTLGNGAPEPVEALPDGREVHTWTQSEPHPSYLVTLVAGTFDDVTVDAGGVEVHHLVPPGWGARCEDVFGRTDEMMAFFQEWTGTPYPWPRYSQVTVWDFHWGGMENTGATTLNMRALHEAGVRPDYSADGLVAHELAHQWFGDLLTCRDWNDIWLNEGFATYFTDLWVEHQEGREAMTAEVLGQQRAYMEQTDLAALAAAPPRAHPTRCGDMERHPYVKGAAVLNMLRSVVGDAAFQRGIRRYLAENRLGCVDSEGLRAAVEAEAGTDLAWFFDQWVYGDGHPELVLESEWVEADRTLRVRAVQAQPVSATRPLFRTPLDVAVTWPDGSEERRRLELFRGAHEWRIRGPAAPRLVRFDPDGWLLADLNVRQDRSAWEAQLRDAPGIACRLRAARALGELGEDAVPALVAAATRDARHEVRAEAARALGRIGGERASGGLVLAGNDPDSRVRTAAFEAMAKCPAPLVADTLRRRLLEDPSVYAAAEAGAALGATKADGAFDALVAALERPSHRDRIRERVLAGLKALGDPRGAEVARRYLDYRWGGGVQHRLRGQALETLRALAPDAPETRAAVLSLLRDPYFRMRNWAAEAAAEMRLEEALPVLRETAESGTGPNVREQAAQAIARLVPAPPADASSPPPADAASRLELEGRVARLRAELGELERRLAELAR